MEVTAAHEKISFSRPKDNTMLVELAGSWKIGQDLPAAVEIQQQLKTRPEIKQIAFNTESLSGWDSSLLTFLIKVIDDCSRLKIHIDKNGLPEGVQGLIALATAVPEKKDVEQKIEHKSFLEKVGGDVVSFVQSTGEMMAFLGEAFVATVRILTGKARFRPYDLGVFFQECGAQALPIVLLSFGSRQKGSMSR